MHAVVPPVGLLEATNAPGTGESDIFHGEKEGKRARLEGQRSDRSEQSEVNGSSSLRLGVQKVVFLMKMRWADLQKCASR